MSELLKPILRRINQISIPLAIKMILGYLFIIAMISTVFMVVGAEIISNRIVAEAQEKVRHDLNAAREIYLSKLTHINDVIRITADRFFLREALLYSEIEQASDELTRIKEEEELDILTITDQYGNVILRTSNRDSIGDNQSDDELIKRVISEKKPHASTMIISREDLQVESPYLAEQAHIKLVNTPMARHVDETEETAGMMLKAAAPIFDPQSELIGVVYGGVLLNKNFEIVDRIKQTVYENVKYKGKDIGTATIFQDDVRISTNVINEVGSRAIGTRVAEEVYKQVVIEGKPWIGRAFVVTNWYITAYEPIRDINQQIIGILYVGVLEEKYLDIQRQTIYTFLAITIAGALITLAASYFISQRILIPIHKLVSASREIANGNLDATVEIRTGDELQHLADSFNAMASSLRKRDTQLKEFATRKIMESEKLALIGQLSANVAHELNNPLTGIVTYSHLLLERTPNEDQTRTSIEKIVGQANRCRDIIRGLLDFSRQRLPEKTLGNINAILQDCISLVENQALFHNIQIVENYQKDLPMIVIDPSQIERVYMNLIINAAEAMDGKGQLTITTRLDSEDKFVEVEFSDTGHGISEEHMDRLFDPFFTTKEVGHGTGLGLAISYGIVKSHNGSISVRSEVGKGTTFIVKLPINGNKAAVNG